MRNVVWKPSREGSTWWPRDMVVCVSTTLITADEVEVPIERIREFRPLAGGNTGKPVLPL